MMTELVLYEVRDGVATITLNRPERLNAISPRLDEELLGHLGAAEADAGVHCAVIQGAGRCFSSGADTKRDEASGQLVPTSATADRDGREANLRRYLRVWDLRIPVIAKVHGYCLGRATQLVLSCDVAFAAEDAVIGAPRLPLGAGFNAVFWAWHVGPKRAKEVFLPTGGAIDGRTAARWGIVNDAVPLDQLDARVEGYTRKLTRTPRELLALQKQAINRTQEVRGMREALAQSVEVNIVGHHSESVHAVNRDILARGLRATLEDRAGDG